MKCKCGKSAIYFRRYEGRLLCKHCYLRSVESKIKRTIRKHKMVEKGDRVAIAMSGGKDSSTIAYILQKVFGQWPDVKIMAITINEGITPYRTENIRKAKKLAKELGMEHHIFSFKEEFGRTSDQISRMIEKQKKGVKGNEQIQEVCTYCGVGRRYLMNKKVRELGATKLCVGHNLDDEVQAALLNYIRGDLARAGRMGAVTKWSTEKKGGEAFIPRIKPLRDIPEREVALFAQLKGFDIMEGHCPHAGGVRFDVREFINNMELKYPGTKFGILETFDRINPCIKKVAEDKYSKEGKSRIQKCKKCGEPSSRKICKACELWRP